MFEFLKRGTEFHEIAKSFNSFNLLLNQTIAKSQTEDITQNLYFLAYMGRLELLDRFYEYKWPLNTLIIVPSISNTRIPLKEAFSMTITRLLATADASNDLDEVTEILEKGQLYHDLDKSIPEFMKKMM